MASTYSSSSCMVAACFLAALITVAAARQYMVGGSAGWVPPASGTISYNDWAGKNRFLIGDSLVFKYNPSVNWVARVSAEDYNSCSTSNPIASYKDGNTVFQFPTHGPFYFISGNSSNCNSGQKLIVVVLSPRNTSHFSHSPSPAPTTAATPSPAPTTVMAPSPAPTTVMAPSPAPTTAAIPSPAPTTAATPTPAPMIATPVASPTVAPSMSPAGAPSNLEPLKASPSPAPMGNTGGGTPAGSAPGATVPRLVYGAVTLVTVVLSGALTLGN